MNTVKKALGFYESFDRKGTVNPRTTHFCPGCDHGIIHKLIAEALTELRLQDKTIFVSPVGCATFCYYYFDCGHVAGPHGRASAVATGIARSLKNKVVISYQGDGDLGAIGFNNAFQAANRGEKIACFFVNNSIFAMTGGQMAPTTLPGQKTATTPFGRDIIQSGHPLRVCEVFNQLEAPVYIERVSLADTRRIMQAKRAIRKALEIQRDGKGYAFVEFLSMCPTNWRMDMEQSARFVTEEMEKAFPLGCFRDRSLEPVPNRMEIPLVDCEQLFKGNSSAKEPQPDPTFPELRFKFTGFGGQGILSLGLVLALAAGRSGRFVSWFPSYGPEQRGGAASCSVVVSGKEIGSPSVDNPDVLIAMNQPSLEKFYPTVAPSGTIIYEASIALKPGSSNGVKVVPFPAMEIAARLGVPRAANTAMLGVLTALGLHRLPECDIMASLEESFAEKPQLISKNLKIFQEAILWARNHLDLGPAAGAAEL